jgi:hypothetical protein
MQASTRVDRPAETVTVRASETVEAPQEETDESIPVVVLDRAVQTQMNGGMGGLEGCRFCLSFISLP